MIKIDERHSTTIALRKAEAKLQEFGEKRQQKDLELQEKNSGVHEATGGTRKPQRDRPRGRTAAK